MPLHLLGKKSWNVYNADNIAKVKRDEAAAAAREADEEQRMQEVDAERRIQILRGLRPDPVPEESQITEEPSQRGSYDRRPDSKRRRLAGEDDTDRDLRIAREKNEIAASSSQALTTISKTSDAPLTDSKGHISLFPEDGPKRKAPKNAEAEAEAAKKKKEYEDQYTMRFSNAAGFKESIGQTPWYSSGDALQAAESADEPVSKDVWGNEDPRRKERAQMRLQSDDPMAMIQKGVTELRQVEKERKKWQAERDKELTEMIEAERRREKKKRRRRRTDDELEGFSLDDPVKGGHSKKDHKHHHRSRDRSRERSPEDKHHRHRRTRSHDRNGHRPRSKHDHGAGRPHISTLPNERAGWERSSSGRYSSQFAHC